MIGLNRDLKILITLLFFVLPFLQIETLCAGSIYEREKSNILALTKTLRNNGIQIVDHSDYHELIKSLKKAQIEVPSHFKESVTNYLDSKEAQELITAQASKPGILSWYFTDVYFLKKDLIFAQYEDGEMNGGDILIKVIYSEDRVVNMKNLWEID